MANLSDVNRALVAAEYNRSFPHGETCSATKNDIRAATDAIDAWLNTNAAAMNSAIPQPARGLLTVKQKARLLMRVVSKRYDVEV